MTSPPMMQPQVLTSAQPQLEACSKPRTLSAIPAATRAAPGQSIFSRRGAEWMPASSVSTTARMATGMLIQKIARQVHWVR